MQVAASSTQPQSQRDRFLVVFLRVVGGVSLLAFAAAVMPEEWMIAIAKQLQIDPFPNSPLTFYLARNLSLLYGFVGSFLIVISFDLPRYRTLVWFAAVGTIAFGLLQLVVDSLSGLPPWWTLGESCSTLVGGILFYLLQRDNESSAE